MKKASHPYVTHAAWAMRSALHCAVCTGALWLKHYFQTDLGAQTPVIPLQPISEEAVAGEEGEGPGVDLGECCDDCMYCVSLYYSWKRCRV